MTPTFLIIDLFCGAGGTTTGFAHVSNGAAKVIACVNHDHKAIESHWRNHPEVKHFEEDVRTLDLTDLVELTTHYQTRYPDAKLILWASLECTNFSKAKGGLPREADSRTLADHLDRYVLALQPDYVQIENVVEFMSWGPLDKNGKPVSRQNGRDWMRWRKRLCSYGYRDEWKQLNSADFGAYTSRNRLFGVFAKDDMPIAWPSPSHSRNPHKHGLHQSLHKWKPVKDVLNFSDEGESIFTRKKPLSEKTLERIYAGLVKYVAGGKDAFISKYFSGKPEGKNISVDGPAGTIKTVDGQALVQAQFLVKYNSMNKNGNYVPPSIEEPSPTITTQNRLYLTTPSFLAAHYSNGDNVRTTDEPCPTVTTKDRFELVMPQHFIDKQYGSGGYNMQSIEQPAGSLTSIPKLNLVKCEPFLVDQSFGNTSFSVQRPAPTILACRKNHYLVNPQYWNNGASIEKPCFTLIARMDKKPPYLVTTDTGDVAIEVYETDSECCKRIKEFMAMYGIVNIKMRMLKVPELLRIQGFPNEYKLSGTQGDQKKFIGNSVVPLVVQRWCEALVERIKQPEEVAA